MAHRHYVIPGIPETEETKISFDDLEDVSVGGASDKDDIWYNSSSAKWESGHHFVRLAGDTMTGDLTMDETKIRIGTNQAFAWDIERDGAYFTLSYHGGTPKIQMASGGTGSEIILSSTRFFPGTDAFTDNGWAGSRWKDLWISGQVRGNQASAASNTTMLEFYDLADETQITGTVSITGGATALTGAGTSFTTELAIGDRLRLNSVNEETFTITAIADNTNATVELAANNTNSGVDAYQYTQKFGADKAGKIPVNLIPSFTGLYSHGTDALRWKDAFYSGSMSIKSDEADAFNVTAATLNKSAFNVDNSNLTHSIFNFGVDNVADAGYTTRVYIYDAPSAVGATPTFTISSKTSTGNAGDFVIDFVQNGGVNEMSVLISAGSESDNAFKVDDIDDASVYFNIDIENEEVDQTMDFHLNSDSKKIFLGAAKGLELYNDGTHGYLSETSGDLYLRSTNNNIILDNANLHMQTDVTRLYFGNDDDAYLQHSGSHMLFNNDLGNVLFTTAGTFEFDSDLNVVGDVGGTTHGGIVEANLVDKTANETITANSWTFESQNITGVAIIKVEAAAGVVVTGPAIYIDDTAALAVAQTPFIIKSKSSSSMEIFDSGGTKNIQFNSDGGMYLNFNQASPPFLWMKGDTANYLFYADASDNRIVMGTDAASAGGRLAIEQPATVVNIGDGTKQALRLQQHNADSAVGAQVEMGFSGWGMGASSISEAAIGFITTSNAGSEKGDLYFATRDVTTNTAPTVRMVIQDGGEVECKSDLSTAGEMKGSRLLLSAGTNFKAADAYLSGAGFGQMSATEGFVMPRDGSIVGISVCTDWNVETTRGDLQFEVRKNGANVFSVNVPVNGTGIKTAYATQARGTDTFAAGDIIQLYVDFLSTTAGQIRDTFVLAEVQFDT